MIISCIVAKTKNNVIGKDNKMPWYISDDLKYFKKITSGHTIILGRKNFESIGKALPNRTNIVLTRDKNFKCNGCIVMDSIEKALKYAYESGENEAFIIGGGQIYDQSVEYWDKMYITEIDTELEGDVFFPEQDKKEWKLISEECHRKSEKNEYDFCFKIYERTNPR
ncbi:MAG TPA: dihydrofolate reductase [Bacteroidetes bacterium]|nr:dihydrofolate reductase [Bacteroidota bacterium]